MIETSQATQDRWRAKADSLWLAWGDVAPGEPRPITSIALVLAHATIETNCGDAWPLAHDEGATDLRACNAAELAAINAGELHKGWWLYADGVTYGAAHKAGARGILEYDSHPGGVTYAVWFAAFDDDQHGFEYMLHVVFRTAKAALVADDASPATYAVPLYLGCYYEGTSTGARPCGRRSLPLNAGEQANVDKYAHGLGAVLPPIVAALVGWVPIGEVAPDAAPPELVGDMEPPQDLPTGRAARGEPSTGDE